MFFSSHFTSHLITDFSVFIVRKGRAANANSICYLLFAICHLIRVPRLRGENDGLPSLVWKKLAAHGENFSRGCSQPHANEEGARS